jgi:hypothetical protein
MAHQLLMSNVIAILKRETRHVGQKLGVVPNAESAQLTPHSIKSWGANIASMFSSGVGL